MPLGTEPPPALNRESLRVGDWTIEPALNQLSAAGKTVKLEPKAMATLVYLANRPGQVVSREALLSAVPKPDPRLKAERVILEREVADLGRPPPGCHFHPRCRYVQERCRVEPPPLEQVEENRWVSCHRAGELSLRGVG